MPKEERVRVFKDYQVNRDLMQLGNIGCKFMHCLPATRGEDVTDEVADSDASLCWDEAGNRLTAMRGLLVYFTRYDLDKFASEMQKLGWTKGSNGIYERNGQKFSFTIQVRDYEEERVDIANIVSKQLKQAGVDMQIKLVTKFDWKAGYNGFLSGYAVEFDPDGAYKQFTTEGSDNTMKYSNAAVDDILTKARHEKDATARKALYSQFEEAFSENPTSVLIAYLNGNYVSVSGLKGLDTTRVLGHHAVGVMWNIEDWTITR